jgi:ABC-2 type transport system permease protein
VLKRVRGTPIPSWVYIGGQLLSSVVIAALLVASTVALGVAVYGVQFRTDTVPGLVSALVLGALCFCSLGVAVTALVPNSDAAPAVVNFSLFPLLFVSGIFFPIDNAPQWLHSLASAFPVQHLANALQYAFDPRTAAPGVNVSDLLMLAVWTMAGLVIALRVFRWESRRS